MSKTANMNIRIDPVLKSEVEAIYLKYGMSITDAINIFLYTSKTMGELPFDLRPHKPNAQTIAAIKEGLELLELKSETYDTSVEILKELNK